MFLTHSVDAPPRRPGCLLSDQSNLSLSYGVVTEQIVSILSGARNVPACAFSTQHTGFNTLGHLHADNLQPLARVIDGIDDAYASTVTIANAIMEEIARAEKGGATVELLTIIPMTTCPEYNISPGLGGAPVAASDAEPLVLFAICVSGA